MKTTLAVKIAGGVMIAFVVAGGTVALANVASFTQVPTVEPSATPDGQQGQQGQQGEQGQNGEAGEANQQGEQGQSGELGEANPSSDPSAGPAGTN